jgi:micrococcal nuclease
MPQQGRDIVVNPAAWLKPFIFYAAILLIAPPAHADFEGKVIGVHYGDAITLLSADNRQVKVRAAEIDAPELKQPYGQAAREIMALFVFGKQVTISGEHPDRSGRMVGEIIAPSSDDCQKWRERTPYLCDPVNMSEMLVIAGYPWDYRAYSKLPSS